MGRNVPPHGRGVFLPSKTGGQEDRGSQPTHWTYPRLCWASPDRWTASIPAPVPTCHGPCQCTPLLGDGDCQGPLPISEGEARGAGMSPHSPLNGEGGIGVSKRGVLLRRFPAEKRGNSQRVPQLVGPCSSLLCYSLGGLFKYSSSLSSLLHSPAHTATPPNVITKREKIRGTQL